MSEENTQPTPEAAVEATPEQEAPQDAPATEAAETPTPEAPVYDWRKALDEAPAEEIRRHPKFAGILGSEKPLWQQEWQTREQERLATEARTKAEKDLEDLAQRNPVEFADRWLGQNAAKKAQEQIQNLETNARQALGKQIGAAMHAIPEWGDVANDPEALATLAKALEGKSNDEVITAWNTAALGLVADRRAKALADKLIETRLKEERQAWETEAAARGLIVTDRPDLVRGGRQTSADPEPDYVKDPGAWDAWYRRTTRGAA